MMRRKERQIKTGQAICGLTECLIAFGVALDAAGLMTRKDLARRFRLLIDQQRRNSAIGSQEDFEARISAPLALAEFFEIPVSNGPIVIKGGKAAAEAGEPPPAA